MLSGMPVKPARAGSQLASTLDSSLADMDFVFMLGPLLMGPNSLPSAIGLLFLLGAILRFLQILIERHQQVLRATQFNGECLGCSNHLSC